MNSKKIINIISCPTLKIRVIARIPEEVKIPEENAEEKIIIPMFGLRSQGIVVIRQLRGKIKAYCKGTRT